MLQRRPPVNKTKLDPGLSGGGAWERSKAGNSAMARGEAAFCEVWSLPAVFDSLVPEGWSMAPALRRSRCFHVKTCEKGIGDCCYGYAGGVSFSGLYPGKSVATSLSCQLITVNNSFGCGYAAMAPYPRASIKKQEVVAFWVVGKAHVGFPQ